MSIFSLHREITAPENIVPPQVTHPIRLSEPKPVIVFVPGFSAKPVLLNSLGIIQTGGYTCSEEAKPIPLGERDNYFKDMPQWFIEDGGYDVRLASLDNNYETTPSILINATCLRKQILDAANQSETGDVLIIAHSMGGLVTRAYIQSKDFIYDTSVRGKSPVSKVFLLASPNQSMPFYFWLNLFLDCENPGTQYRAACEFSSSKWVGDFNNMYNDIPESVDFYTVGGTLHNNWLGFLAGSYICLIDGPNDGTIPTFSSIHLEGARGSAYYQESHLPMVGNPSYVSEYLGYKSKAYSNCLYPVILGGNPDGCVGEVTLECRSLNAMRTIILEIIFLSIYSIQLSVDVIRRLK